jgi:peptidoglycan/xylan/chitin deacetylase (PgdA/CDA1 family)
MGQPSRTPTVAREGGPKDRGRRRWALLGSLWVGLLGAAFVPKGSLALAPHRPAPVTVHPIRGTGPRSGPRPFPSAPALPQTVYFGPETGHRIYLTIDDGWVPSGAALRLLVGHAIPFAAFVTGEAVRRHPGFWRLVVRREGALENHTYSHPLLSALNDRAIAREVARGAEALVAVGSPPAALFRPPYGAASRRVLRALAKAGVRRVVLWSAVVAGGRITTFDGRPLRAGEIVLAHWTSRLPEDLAVLLGAARRSGLTFGRLPGMPPLPQGKGGRLSA